MEFPFQASPSLLYQSFNGKQRAVTRPACAAGAGGLGPAHGGGPPCLGTHGAGLDGPRGTSALVAACSGAERYPRPGLAAKASSGASRRASSYSRVPSWSRPTAQAWRCHINHHQQEGTCWDSPTRLCYLHRQPRFSVYIKRASACRNYRSRYNHSFIPHQCQALRGPGRGERCVKWNAAFWMLWRKGEVRLFYSAAPAFQLAGHHSLCFQL